MNCPTCRRRLDYEASLSTPTAKDIKDKQLVYYCSSCKTFCVFKQITTKLTIGGRLVMQIQKLRRAGFFELKDRTSALRSEHPRIEGGSLTDLAQTNTEGDTS